MTDRPIIFSAQMIRALLAGRKVQTRRLIKDEVRSPPSHDSVNPANAKKKLHPTVYLDSYCSDRITAANPRGMSNRWCWWTRDDRQCIPTFKVPYVPGDRLWAREGLRFDWRAKNWRYDADQATCVEVVGTELEMPRPDRWPLGFCVSIHMPRVLSRLTLIVTDVRVERLNEISEEDAQAEGVEPQKLAGAAAGFADAFRLTHQPFKSAYANLWNSLHGDGAWDLNPYVAAVRFRVVTANIDSLEEQAA